MSKVWNIVGSFMGGSNLIPENATFTKLEVLPQSLDTYYNGETFRQDLTFFQATFTSDEGEQTKITIPSKDVKPKNFVPEVPFTNTLDHEITRHLEFEWTYIPAGADKDDPSQHQTKDCSFEITIWPERFTVKTVEVIVPPSKTIYYDGETFNHAGMVVQATSEEGDTKNIEYCGSAGCSEDRDCYYYNTSPLHAGDSETVDIQFTYCVPADGDHPNGYIAQFTYPVTVYRDERKAQLKVTYDAHTTVRKYYSGKKFNSEGIKVQKKYPRDDESAYDDPNNTVTSQCRIYVQEFPNGILQYNDSNGGYLNVVVEYYDSVTKLTTTEVVPNIVFVYEVAQVQVSHFRKNEFYIGDPFDSSLATLRVDYKPSSLPLDDYSGYITSNDYSWTRTEYIDSAGKFLKPGQNIVLQLNYYDENDPKSPKTRYEAGFSVNILKKIKKLSFPRYTGKTEYSGTQGIKILRNLNVTSGTSLVDGYEDISVNGTWGYSTPQYIDSYFTATSNRYKYTIGVKIKAEDDTYTYQWEDGFPASVTKTVSVTLKREYSLSFDTSSLYLTGENTSASTYLTLTSGLDLNASISLTGLTAYLSCSPTSTSSSTTVNVNVESVPFYDYSDSTTLKATLNSVPDYLTGPTQDTVTVYFNYEVPWNWNDALSTSWISGLKKNSPSNYVGQYKDAEGERFFLLDVNGSTLTWGCFYDTGPFKTSSQSLSNWSSGGYNNSGGVQIQRVARTFEDLVSGLFGTPKSQTRYYKYDNNTRWKSCSMRCWPPTMEEIGLRSASNRVYSAHSSNSSRFDSGNVFNGSFWVGNGAWASEDGSTIGGSGLGNVAAAYNVEKGTVGTLPATTGNYNYVFCFKI